MILILLGCSHKLKSLFYFQTSFCAVEGLLSCKPCETREFYPFRFSLPLISERNVKWLVLKCWYSDISFLILADLLKEYVQRDL